MYSLALAILATIPSIDTQVRFTPDGYAIYLDQTRVATLQKEPANLSAYAVGPITVLVWDASDTKAARYLRIDAKGQSRSGRIDTRIHLRGASFDPLVDLPETVDLRSLAPEENLRIVQLRTPPWPEYRAALSNAGAEVLAYLPANAFVVRIQKTASSSLDGLAFVRWHGAYQPAYRLDPYFVENIGRAELVFPLESYQIQLFDGDPENKLESSGRIRQLGGQMISENAGRKLIAARLTPDQLIEVINWDAVEFVDRWSDYEEDMDIVRELTGANYVETLAGYDGTGVRGEVFDGGFNTTHVDFQSRPLILHTPNTSSSHGAATSGIVFGDGTGDIQARGMLPQGQGIVADYDVVPVTGMSRYDNTGELLGDPYYAVFQTSSVGTTRVTDYTTFSADSDTMLFDFDLLHCQSQSNALSRDSRPQAWAKNMVSVGAFNHFNTLDSSDDCWGCTGGGASIGPAPDGRIKPDLSHFYDSTYTVTTGSNTAYGQFGGTSGATPITCGHFGLFFQMWSDGVFGNPTPGSTVFDNRPHLTMAKAMLINTAWQYDFEGAVDDMSRYRQGWGRPDLKRLYDNRDDFFLVNESDLLNNLEKRVYAVQVGPGTDELRLTMTYLDPAGSPAASSHTINDLDLRVTSPDGKIYWGNNGLVDGNFSKPGGLPTQIDTVENVWVETPAQGTWTVEVLASNIIEDNHVETGAIDADFSLAAHPVTSVTPVLYISPSQNFPELVAPATPTTISLHVRDGSATLNETPMMHYRFDSGGFASIAMTPTGGETFSADIPAAAIGQSPEFYFTVQGQSYPQQGATSPFAFSVDSDNPIFEDDMETDMGWTIGAVDDTATTGIWERIDPVSTSAQPELDHTPGLGSMAYITGQSNDPASNGENDIDGGKTTLISPVLDLSAQPEADIEYRRWYSNNTNNTIDDSFRVDVTNDGATWVNVETIGPSGPGTSGSWILHRFRVADFVSPTANVQLRFVAEDSGGGSIVEAGIDDVRALVELEPSCLPLNAYYSIWPTSASILDMIGCMP